MSVVAVDEYVCPRCGASAAGNSACAGCGEDLDAFAMLPRRSEYEADGTAATGRGPRSPRLWRTVARLPSVVGPLPRKLMQALRDRPEVLGVAISAVPLFALFLPWFHEDLGEGPSNNMFDLMAFPLTAWEAFSWEDVALAVLALGLAAATFLPRRPEAMADLPVGLAALGTALAVAMIANPPLVPPETAPGRYVSTHLGWIAVAGFAAAAVTSVLRWWRSTEHAGQP